MLTSSNQYLRPEYLTPLPTTLDAKKSPLALLAQTCSAIGADSPNPKLLASIEKSSKSSNTSSKTPTSTMQSTTPINSHASESNNNTINTKPIQSPISAVRTSPITSNTSVSPKVTSSFKPYEATPVKSPNSELRARTPKRTHTPLRTTSSNSSSANSPLPDRQSPIQSSPKTNLLPPSPSYMLGLPSPLGLDHLKAAYLNYARTLKPECRDPYCTGNCVPAVNPLLGLPPPPPAKICPAGCVQCDHQKIPYGSPTNQNQAMAFAHAQLYALASANASQPYVCNWISSVDSNTYCGKRFSNSEELLQHLRQHTTSGTDLISQNHHLLRNSYPTPPLSPLTMSGVRYHPYAKPILPHGLNPTHSLNPMMAQAHLFGPGGMGFPPYFGPYGGFGVPPMPNLSLAQSQLAKNNGQNGLHH